MPTSGRLGLFAPLDLRIQLIEVFVHHHFCNFPGASIIRVEVVLLAGVLRHTVDDTLGIAVKGVPGLL